MDRAKSEEIRSHDERVRSINRTQPIEYDGGRMQNYHMQTESQFAGKTSNSDFFHEK